MRIAIEVIGRVQAKEIIGRQIARHPKFHKSKHVFYYIKSRTYMTKSTKIKLILFFLGRNYS